MQKHLGTPRLSSVQAYFQATSDDDLLGCYAWCQAVASGLLPILGDFEVAFRNAIHRALSQYYAQQDSYDWMVLNGNAQTTAAHHSLGVKSRQDITDMVAKIARKKRGRVLTPDDVVAALSFGFWEVLVGSLGHKSHPAGLQAAVLASVFPHAPDLGTCSHGDPAFRTRVTNLLARLRDTRNRIGHHDSIWTTPEFDLHGKLGLIPRRPRQSVASLRQLAERICWFAGWIDPAIPAYIRQTDHWWSFQALLSQPALATYRRNGGRIGTYKALLTELPTPAGGVIGELPGNPGWFLDRVKRRVLDAAYHY